MKNMNKYENVNKYENENKYSATSLVRPKLEELIPEKKSLEKIPKPLSGISSSIQGRTRQQALYFISIIRI